MEERSKKAGHGPEERDQRAEAAQADDRADRRRDAGQQRDTCEAT
jgi:hypothetical protein